jgi:hypothetical protein
VTGTQTICKPASVDPALKDDAIELAETLPHQPQFNVSKQPPYSDQDIEDMLDLVRREDILCTSPTCYSVVGAGGTACGACCS